MQERTPERLRSLSQAPSCWARWASWLRRSSPWCRPASGTSSQKSTARWSQGSRAYRSVRTDARRCWPRRRSADTARRWSPRCRFPGTSDSCPLRDTWSSRWSKARPPWSASRTQRSDRRDSDRLPSRSLRSFPLPLLRRTAWGAKNRSPYRRPKPQGRWSRQPAARSWKGEASWPSCLPSFPVY